MNQRVRRDDANLGKYVKNLDNRSKKQKREKR